MPSYDRWVRFLRVAAPAAAFASIVLVSGCMAASVTDSAVSPAVPSQGGARVATAPGDSTPTGSPSTTTDGPRNRQFTVAANGDILIHNSLWIQAEQDGHGQMDFAPQLAGIKTHIANADLAICHLETPLSNPGGPFANYPVFNTPPQVTRAIKSTGYDACSTASNHTLDQGFTGVKRTLDALDAVGVGHAGSARSQQEASTPKIYTVKGVKVAHLAYTYGFNGYQVPSAEPWCCNTVSAPRMITDAKAARDAGAEVVIVSMHAGEENVATPNSQQRSVAKALADSGLVNLVIGNHVHVVQPAQKIGNMWIVYGHGNLISGQHVEDHRNREGVVSEFTFTEQSDGGFGITRAVGYPVLNTANPVRLVDLVRALPKSGGDSRWVEAYEHTRATLLSMGAGKDGFVVPAPGSRD